jgi:hypothetical protein
MKGGNSCWFLFACLLFCDFGMAQDLQVLVLDALDGKPQANVKVEYFCVGPPRNTAPNKVITDSEGSARISISCTDNQKIEMSVFPPNKKEQCNDDAVMTFNEVASVGFVSKPDSSGAVGAIWCPTKVSKKLKPVPGRVVIFVKKPTWWQSHVAG